jgi:hypothetical protein
MAKLEEQINLIEQLDQLIRMQATGSPKKLSERLGISGASLFRLLDVMKKLKAPIKYDIYLQSYIYEYKVYFEFGFYAREISTEKAREINGGYANIKMLLNF